MSVHVAQQFLLCPYCREPGCKPSDFDIAMALDREQIVAKRMSWEQWHIRAEIHRQTQVMRQVEQDEEFARNLVENEVIAKRDSWCQWHILVEIKAQTRARNQEEARRERQVEEDANIALLLHESLIEVPS